MVYSNSSIWIIHTVPYLLLTYALWTIAVKRFMFLRKTGVFDEEFSEDHKWVKLKLWPEQYQIHSSIVQLLSRFTVSPTTDTTNQHINQSVTQSINNQS